VVPAGKGSVADRLEPGVAGRIIPEQDVICSVAEEVPNADRRIAGVGAADLCPSKAPLLITSSQVSPVAWFLKRTSEVPEPVKSLAVLIPSLALAGPSQS